MNVSLYSGRMKNRIITLFLSVLFIAHSAQAQNGNPISGQVLIKFKKGAEKSLAGINRDLQKHLSTSPSQASNTLFKATEMEPVFNNRTPVSTERELLSSVYKIRFSSQTSIDSAVNALQALDLIEYVQPNYRRRLHFAPNDELFSQQEALQIIRAEQAWDIQTASSEIIVGVIDTGIDYEHEDLHDALWVNNSEDLNGNGRFDDNDMNGIDDDGNGFIDDVIGWDFTDAPGFPDSGDYLQPDNEPFDEHGHGSIVSGIIGATGNNSTGIAGLAFGAKIMTLRAGTSLGFLEEDDVAAAIVYAVENGAHIINMSFGDVVASPLLRDVMHFAHSKNVILVASSGNSSSEAIHYPSGFSTTISVGATNNGDVVASFSNYGSSVDLVAPGVDILSTQPNNSYGRFSGTSFSAPLVSATAALILSKMPELTNDEVKGLLQGSAVDLGSDGWDNFYANGRIDAQRALSSNYHSVAEIIYPDVDAGFSDGSVAVKVTAAGAFLQSVELFLGQGETPTKWTSLVLSEDRRWISDSLFSLNIADLEDGVYTLKLVARSRNQNTIEDKTRISVDRSSPVFSNIKQTPLLDGDRASVLIEFETDEICNVAIFYRRRGTVDFHEKQLRFSSKEHRLNFTRDIESGLVEYYLKAINLAGLSAEHNNRGQLYQADLSAPAIGAAPMTQISYQTKSAFFLSKASDFDADGKFEIIANEYVGDFDFGSLKIMEFEDGAFETRFVSEQIFIPRDWGDSNNNGRLEILAGQGAKGVILEATAPNRFPDTIVREFENAWLSRFADLDKDGLVEIILRIDDVFRVWESTGDNDFTEVAKLPNPTDGTNFVGVPHVETGDFDGDGLVEVLIGDFDGDVYIYETVADNKPEFTWSAKMPLVDSIDYLATGDFDGDGVAEFAVGCHSDPNLNLESNFDSRHWIFRIYDRTDDNEYAPVWQQAFFGFQSPNQFDSGVASGDVDNDGDHELLLTLFPDFYLIDFDRDSNQYAPVWHALPARSNTSVVADFDNDGENEFYYNNGNAIIGKKRESSFTGSLTPTGFSALPIDASSVRLAWQFKDKFDYFNIYRGVSSDSLLLIGSTTSFEWKDRDLWPDTLYYFAVATVNQAMTPQESRPTSALGASPRKAPTLLKAKALSDAQIELQFSAVMGSSAEDQTNYLIQNIGSPTSAIRAKSGAGIILSRPAPLPPGEYKVWASNLFDSFGAAIDTINNSAIFTVFERPEQFYLLGVEIISKTELRVEFSDELEKKSAENVENYQIMPDIEILQSNWSETTPRSVVLTLSPHSTISPKGKEFHLVVYNIQNRSGAIIQTGLTNSAAFVIYAENLGEVYAYPNPFRQNETVAHITIAGLTEKATIHILDNSGRLIRKLEEVDGDGGIAWDLKNENGRDVSSGVYLFFVKGAGQTKRGKFVIIR